MPHFGVVFKQTTTQRDTNANAPPLALNSLMCQARCAMKNNYWIQATTIHKREVKKRRKRGNAVEQPCPSRPCATLLAVSLLPSSKLSFEEMLLEHRSEHGFIPKSLSRPEKGVLISTAVSGVITLELKIGLLILVQNSSEEVSSP